MAHDTWHVAHGTPLAAGDFGLVTWGAAAFDDVTLNVAANTNGDESRAYYAFGTVRIERKGSGVQQVGSSAPVYYLAADHLNSTSLAIDTNGQMAGTRAYYTPWGAERGPAAGLPTDFTYTGQRASVGLKLVAMGARWLDTALGRWVSADTIVPSPANPQSLNRFSYVINRPLVRVDPSGHRDCGELSDEDCFDERTVYEDVYHRARRILRLYGLRNDLEALAMISDLVASSYSDKEQYMVAMNSLLLGTPSTGPLAARDAAAAITSGGCDGLGWEPGDCRTADHYFGDRGFHKDYQDGHNQVFHVWAFVAETASARPTGFAPLDAFMGWFVAAYANSDHEYWGSARGEIKSSWQDAWLSDAGIQLGLQLNVGLITPGEAGAYMREKWGPNGGGTGGKEDIDRFLFGPLYGETHPVDVWNNPLPTR